LPTGCARLDALCVGVGVVFTVTFAAAAGFLVDFAAVTALATGALLWTGTFVGLLVAVVAEALAAGLVAVAVVSFFVAEGAVCDAGFREAEAAGFLGVVAVWAEATAASTITEITFIVFITLPLTSPPAWPAP
jgi:hypothetical protein